MVLTVIGWIDESTNPTVSWDTYIIQDWGDGTCTNGTRLDDIGFCRAALSSYKRKCETQDEEVQSESWDGPSGCHIQDAGFAEFQFNKNFNEGRAGDHAPVCQVGEAQPLNCYNEEEAEEEAETGLGGVLRSIFVVLMVIPPVVMSISRLCVPACCPGGMGNVAGCCPFSCFTQLDTTYYVAGVLQLLLMLIAFFVSFSLVVGGVIAFFVSACTVIATVIATCVKLGVMADCCCQDCKPASRCPSSPYAGDPQTVVVGQVVVGQPVNAVQGGKAVD